MIASEPLMGAVSALFAYRQDLLDDPFPLYHRLQDEAPVLEYGGVFSVSRYQDCEDIIRNLEDYSNNRGRGRRVEEAVARLDAERGHWLQEAMDFMDLWVVAMDPPDHTRVRQIAHRVFTPARIATLEPLVQRITEELIEDLAAAGTFDFVSGFSFHLPMLVVGSMLGSPPSDRERIRRWSGEIGTFIGANFSNVDEMHRTLTEFRAHIRELITERRRSRHTDLLAALIDAEESGDRLSTDELEAMFVLLLFAGHETTTNLIGNLLHTLLMRPDQMERLRRDRALIPEAVEEILRHNGSAQIIHRFARNTTGVDGVEIPAGATIRLWLGAANRDLRRHPDPDTFDVNRADKRSLGFGIGPHFCLGSALARLETRVAINHLLDRFREIELTAPVHYKPNLTLRGPRALELRTG